MKGLILKIDCPDQSGIVAKIASYVADYSGNLVEFSQFTDDQNAKFFTRVEIDTTDLSIEVNDFIQGFETLGKSLQATWHFRYLPYKMRTAVLLTKTDHCLNEILWRTQLGEMPIEITSIIGNRKTCHYVTSDLDAGPIIEQEVQRVQHFHTPQDLIRLGRDCERNAIARSIRYHVNDRTIIHNNRAIVFPD